MRSFKRQFPKAKTPQNIGEESISGSMPDPESDDDLLGQGRRNR